MSLNEQYLTLMSEEDDVREQREDGLRYLKELITKTIKAVNEAIDTADEAVLIANDLIPRSTTDGKWASTKRMPIPFIRFDA